MWPRATCRSLEILGLYQYIKCWFVSEDTSVLGYGSGYIDTTINRFKS